jgi:hypothetical protein
MLSRLLRLRMPFKAVDAVASRHSGWLCRGTGLLRALHRFHFPRERLRVPVHRTAITRTPHLGYSYAVFWPPRNPSHGYSKPRFGVPVLGLAVCTSFNFRMNASLCRCASAWSSTISRATCPQLLRPRTDCERLRVGYSPAVAQPLHSRYTAVAQPLHSRNRRLPRRTADG